MSEVQESKQAQNVVTSENLAEFNQTHLRLAPDEPVEATEEVEPTESEDESGQEAVNEATEPEKKQNPKLEKRFSELTKQRELARQEAAKEREARTALEARLRELEDRVTPKADPIEEEPKPEQFTDAFEYAKALADYSAENALKKRDQQEAERRVQEERQKVITTWNERLEAAKAEMPDFEDMVASSEVAVSDQVRDAILESDIGPKILYHLAENPEIGEKLAKLSTINALREIGRLEAKLETPTGTAKPVSVSKAPAPIKPIKAMGSTLDNKLDSNGEFHGTYAQWRAARKAGKIR